MEKNLAQHRANEKIVRYKLEAYQKNFPDFISSSSTSTKILGQDEKTKVRPSGIAQEVEMQTEQPQDLINGATQEEVQPKKPQDLKGGGQEEIEPQNIQEQEKVEVIPTPEKEVSQIQYLKIEPQTGLMGEDNRIIEPKVDIEPLILIQVEITKLQQGRQMFRRI